MHETIEFCWELSAVSLLEAGLQTELECGGCDTKHTAAGAYCLSPRGGAKAVECAENACEVVDPDPLRPSDERLAHWPDRLFRLVSILEGVKTHSLPSLSLYFAAAAKRRHDLGVRLAKGLLMR